MSISSSPHRAIAKRPSCGRACWRRWRLAKCLRTARRNFPPRPKRARCRIGSVACWLRPGARWRINATRKAMAISCRMSCCFRLLKNAARWMPPRGFGASRPRHWPICCAARGWCPIHLPLRNLTVTSAISRVSTRSTRLWLSRSPNWRWRNRCRKRAMPVKKLWRNARRACRLMKPTRPLYGSVTKPCFVASLPMLSWPH